MNELDNLVLELMERPTEEEWVEYKENWYQPRGLGEYISCLSNAAAFHGVSTGYMVWGVEDVTHDVVGTIGKSRTAVVKAVRHLRENGYIERIGSDKSGWWRVIKP